MKRKAAPARRKSISTGAAEWLPLSQLRYGRGNPYQRALNERKVQRIVDNFDPDLLGVIEITKRGSQYWVRGGQHRVEALRRLGRREELVLCHVTEYPSLSAEARSARLMDKERTAWSAFDMYKAGLVEGEPVAKGIQAILDKLGIKVVPGASQDQVDRGGLMMAIGTAVKLYGREAGPQLLERCLRVLHAAWPKEAHAYHTAVLSGMALFVAHHDEHIDDTRLVAALKRATPDALLDEAKQLKRSYKWSQSAYVASAIEGAYNLRLARNRLREVGAGTYAAALSEYERRNRVAA